MRKSIALLGQFALAATLGLSSLASHATLLTTQLTGVVIGSNVYTVTFTQADSEDGTTFNDVFGIGSPTFTFTTQADAFAAATAVRSAGDAIDFDYTPNVFLADNGFIVPFDSNDSTFSMYSAWSDDESQDGVFGPLDPNRTEFFLLSFATFELTGQAVPEPGTLALLGLGLLGLGRTRRKAA